MVLNYWGPFLFLADQVNFCIPFALYASLQVKKHSIGYKKNGSPLEATLC